MFVDILKPGLTLTLTCLELIAIQPVSVSSPRQVRQYVKNSSRENSNRKGGLIFTASIYPDVPLKNVEALCQAFEEYMWLKSPPSNKYSEGSTYKTTPESLLLLRGDEWR